MVRDQAAMLFATLLQFAKYLPQLAIKNAHAFFDYLVQVLTPAHPNKAAFFKSLRLGYKMANLPG